MIDPGSDDAILDLEDLSTTFFTSRGEVKAVDHVTFSVQRGESLGIVGESGSGKSVTAMSLLGLVPYPGKITTGRIILDGQSLHELGAREIRKVRGKRLGVIFQNPRTALNPLMRVGNQIDRVYRLHSGASRAGAEQRRLGLLERVGIGDPSSFSRRYPHELSGGMCQRAMIVMALICEPDILIADEPTTGLDVTIQRQIITLLKELQRERQLTLVFITHDMGVVADICERVVVMYGGRVMEIADVGRLFSSAQHPYTRALLDSARYQGYDAAASAEPLVDEDAGVDGSGGQARAGVNRAGDVGGCPYHPACEWAEDRCRVEVPELRPAAGVYAACHLLPIAADERGRA